MLAGHGVGERAVLARAGDGVKRLALAAQFEHLVIEGDGHLALGHAGANDLQNRLEGAAGDVRGAADAFDLAIVLYKAHFFDETGKRRQGNIPQRGLQSGVVVVAEKIRLHGQALCARGGGEFGHQRLHALARARAHAWKRRGLPGGLFHIAEVGEQGLPLRGDKQATLAGKAGEIAHVFRPMDQRRGDSARRHGGKETLQSLRKTSSSPRI